MLLDLTPHMHLLPRTTIHSNGQHMQRQQKQILANLCSPIGTVRDLQKGKTKTNSMGVHLQQYGDL